jgi:hypothetical protein
VSRAPTPDQVLVATGLDPAACGLYVLWSLGGAIKHETLRASWLAAGLPENELVDLPTPRSAVKRALRQFKDRGVIVRPIALQPGEEGSEGYVLVHTATGADGRPVFSNGIEVVLVNDLPVVKKAEDEDTLAIEQTFAHYRQHLIDDDLSPWLVRRIRDCQATALKPTGGVYFVPRTGTARWQRIVDAVKGAAPECRIYGSPALDTGDALGLMDGVLDAAMDAIRREVLAEVEAWDQELDDAEDGNTDPLSKRKLGGRKAAVEALSSKLHTYEALLGSGLDDLRARVVDVDSRLGAELLKAMEPAT